MPVCPSVRCGLWAHDEWLCCAHCGEPLKGQPPAQEESCDHLFVIEGRHCVLCGFDPEVGYTRERFLLGVTGTCICFAGLSVTAASLFFLFRSVPAEEGTSGSGGKRMLAYLSVAGLVGFGYGLSRLFKAMRLD